MSTSLPLRRVRNDDDDDLLALARAVSRHFYEDESDDELRLWLPFLRGCVSLVVEDGDRLVGNFGSLQVDISTPGGGRLPCAGITVVGVSQTHRRRGLLRRMMTAGLDDAVEREQPVAALFASESAIYPRFGYGIAAPTIEYRVDTSRLRFLDPVDPHLVVDLDPADVVAEASTIIALVGDRRPGLVSRTAAELRMTLQDDPPSFRRGASSRRLVQVPGRGYATYRVKDDFRDGVLAGEVRLQQLLATDPEAEQALWQHVLDVDLTATVTADLRPPDDALPWMVEDRLRLRMGESAPLYVRILDVVRCLASRTSAVSDGLVLEVHDPERDAGGTYRWDVSPEGAACSRTDAAPDVVLPIDVLAAVWLGGTPPTRLVDARRLEERTPGAVARLDQMVATEHAPWTPWEF
ncbi:MAG: GNAT family N-acetyltransferase [Nitriliruptor sp.]|uniref:GNAT family N-acetyltransferase n=1 Tax=Nitriliruptor sp. TaxID=2448056 RepID=UPI0034A031A3